MRETKFRGKSVVTGEWLYGSLINNAFFIASDTGVAAVPYILDTDDIDYDDFIDIAERLDDFEVIPESVGQSTGHKDKNGKEVFEGDKYHMGDPNITYTVVWRDAGLIGKQDSSSSFAGIEGWKDQIEVIGNVLGGATNGSS